MASKACKMGGPISTDGHDSSLNKIYVNFANTGPKKPEDKPQASNWLSADLKFIKLDINDIEVEDVVFYSVVRFKDRVAHGPFKVVSISSPDSDIKFRLKNPQGVEFNFSPDGLQFLKLDLIPLLLFDFT